MLNREELEEAPAPSGVPNAAELQAKLEIVQKQLTAARARNRRWRLVVERHLDKGCPSKTLRELLREEDGHADRD